MSLIFLFELMQKKRQTWMRSFEHDAFILNMMQKFKKTVTEIQKNRYSNQAKVIKSVTKNDAIIDAKMREKSVQEAEIQKKKPLTKPSKSH